MRMRQSRLTDFSQLNVYCLEYKDIISMYTPEQMKNIVRSSLHYKLTASSKFWWGAYEDLAKVCNGCGPEDGPNSRNILTIILQRYAPVWAIHDVDYEFHTCTREEADRRMYDNMIAIWRKDFGFWRWLSFSGIFNRVIVIPAAYTTVSKFGKDAWDNIKGVKYEKRTSCDDVCSPDDRMHDGGTKSRAEE